MFKHFFYFLLFLVSLNAQTGNSLKSPTTSVFDFTYNETTTVDINPKESIVEKVLIPISKEIALKRRIPNIYNCGVDTYGNDYCPASLAPADVFWDSLDGYSTSEVGMAIDYTNITSDTVVQPVSQTCLRSTGNLISESPANQWGIYVPAWQGSYAGFEVYVTKISDTQYSIYYRFRADYKWSGWSTSNMNKGEVQSFTWSYRRDVTGFIIDLQKAVFHGLHPKTLGIADSWDFQNMPVCKNCGSNLSASELTQTTLPNLGGTGWLLNNSQGGSTITLELSSDKKKYYYKIQAGLGAPKISIGDFINPVTDSTFYNDGKYDYSINFILTNDYVKVGQYGNYGSIYSFNTLVCYASSSNCPNGYTETTGTETAKGQCKKTIEYTYYNYLCNSDTNTQGYDYTPTSTGGDCNPKETTDLIDTDNDGIGDTCNSSTPPSNNCKREGYKCKNEFEYESFTNGTSESGVGSVTDYASKITTTITAESSISYSGQWVVTSIKYGNFYYEETQLKVGSSVGYPSGNINCNSVVVSACTPNQQTTVISSGNIGSVKGAGGNCRAGDGMGVFLSMQCVNVGSGITCPSGYVLKGSICEKTVENCPSGYIETTGTETSKGQCKGTVNYTYYNYKCSSDETVLNEGGNIQKVDTDNTSINTDILSSDLNSSTPPNGNCKKVIGVGKAAFVDGEWKCSPFMCNGDMKCGFGTCESGTKPSVDKYQDIAYSPIRADFDGSCNGVICDYVMNNKISYCEAEKCPEGDGYKVIMGECYKEECPEGTYLSDDKCLQVN